MEMTGITFDDILDDFKAHEDPENVVVLIDDGDLRAGVIAWKSVCVEINREGTCALEGAARWNWLWTQIRYDQGAFGTVSGVKPQEVGNLMLRLMGLRLIYPDGTINFFAKQYLNSIIIGKLASNAKKGRPPKDKKDERKDSKKD